MIKNLFIYFRLILRLGAVNIIRILFYKIKLKSGILALLTPPFKIKDQKIFDDKNINQVYLNNEYKSQYLRSAEKLLSGNHSFFFMIIGMLVAHQNGGIGVNLVKIFIGQKCVLMK